MTQVLLVEDDAAVRDAVAQTLQLAGCTPRPVSSFLAAKDLITAEFDGIVISDIRMPGRDGFHLLEYAQNRDKDLPVILLTGEGDIPMAVRAMGQGAFGFLEKPCAPADLIAEVERALKTRNLVLENRRLKVQLETGDPASRLIFGISEQSQTLRAHVRLIAGLQTDALILGAPGSGISKVAEVIHLSSNQARAPFEKVAAAGLTQSALQAALQAAETGTLFIDDILALPAESQFGLVQALEDRSGTRLIAGSTRPVRPEVDAGQFNADLYYRLNVSEVRIPSLQDRPEDIPVLFQHYVAQASEQAGLRAPDITPEIIAGLMAQDWPGNARALMSAAMRFAMGVDVPAPHSTELGLSAQMAQVERALLIAALERHAGQASTAAKALKLPRKTFYDKLARYGIKPDAYRR